ncbi:MAG: hypothetical protein ACE5HE_10725, partial [Phycisphaerae bacterium]
MTNGNTGEGESNGTTGSSSATASGGGTASAAPVAPGPQQHNLLVRSAIAGHLYANFDRQEDATDVTDNTDRQNVPTDEARRAQRILRPGAIILPNLDVDGDS